jgi:hypothetical protein
LPKRGVLETSAVRRYSAWKLERHKRHLLIAWVGVGSGWMGEGEVSRRAAESGTATGM